MRKQLKTVSLDDISLPKPGESRKVVVPCVNIDNRLVELHVMTYRSCWEIQPSSQYFWSSLLPGHLGKIDIQFFASFEEIILNNAVSNNISGCAPDELVWLSPERHFYDSSYMQYMSEDDFRKVFVPTTFKDICEAYGCEDAKT